MDTTKTYTWASVSAVQFAEATADGTEPTVLNEIKIIAEGKFNPDFDPGTQAEDRDEMSRQIWNVRPGTPTYKVTISAAKVSLQDVATFTGATLETDSLTIGGTYNAPKPQYFKITGKNVDGDIIQMICYKCYVSAKWSGAVGAAQEVVPLELTLMMVIDNSPEKKLLKHSVVV